MKVQKKSEDNLKREYVITVPAKDIESEVTTKLKEIGKTAKVPGFRPGKIPMPMLKKQYGDRVMGEVIELVVQKSTMEALKKEKVRPAAQPSIEITSFDEGKDLEYSMSFEILPEVPNYDFKKVKIEQEVIDVSDKDVVEALEDLAAQYQTFEPIKEKRGAKDGEQVLIDFKGSIDGKLFDGGTAEGHQLTLGSGQFIPGFEEQLVGKKVGETTVVKVPFPKEYHAPDLAGKDAEFEVKIHEIREGKARKVDDELAKALGQKDLADLKNAMKQRIEQEYGKAARNRAKKELFDNLNDAFKFEVPQSMVKQEFDVIWEQVEHSHHHQHNHAPGEKCDHEPIPEGLREEYEELAERRVKLGIVLADVADKQGFNISNQELSQALTEEAMKYPGQEQRIIEYYQSNPQAIQAFQGPLLEEKAVDYLFTVIEVKDKKVSAKDFRDLLEKEIAEEEKEAAQSKSKAKKSASDKKATGKSGSTSAKKEGAKEAAAKKAPAKKGSAKKAG